MHYLEVQGLWYLPNKGPPIELNEHASRSPLSDSIAISWRQVSYETSLGINQKSNLVELLTFVSHGIIPLSLAVVSKPVTKS